MDKTPQASVAPVEHEVSRRLYPRRPTETRVCELCISCRVTYNYISPERRSTRRRNTANVKDDSNTRERLIKSGLNFILEFGKHIQFESDLERRKEVMTEVLHCIFFLGHIYKNPVPPEFFFPTKELLQQYKELFPRAFQQYASHLPTRTPFSILLDLVLRRNGSTNSEAILKSLAKIKKALQDDDQADNNYTLRATVITECYSGQGQERFYGASLSCSGGVETKIMIALSCIQTWNEAVAHAVWNVEKKGYIKFPRDVFCTAYKIDPESDSYVMIAPCSKCYTIFTGVTFEPPFSSERGSERFPFGNCAETESLSHLLDAEENVRNETRAYLDGKEVTVDRASIIKDAKLKAKGLLGPRHFKITGDIFKFFQSQ
ncbi:uncharacterized protein LOC117404981 isoform X2 [Acipenser ruthenus]|uniref:uncharacterized protein LOC117404981 isoform X2 n=1 Tax=Acipenser ruthenus TaxID=7906 RepID=UPI0027418E89|nr:uncharacterized protein LOC117404981 isoform X2 [Acipenser ruthenus]